MALAMQTRRQQRTESPERWRKALARAIDAGLDVFVVADTGERMVSSASKLDQLHRTDGHVCTCEAALAGDPVCQHRAAFYLLIGALNTEPEPPASAATVICFACRGTSAGCPVCAGAGITSLDRQAAALILAAA